MRREMKIGDRVIGDGHPCYIIGEIGSNHNLDKQTVRDLIDAAAEAKFDAVKFQVYCPEAAFSKNVTTADVHLDGLYGMKPWWEVARDKILMPRDWFAEMFEYARNKKLDVFSAVHRKEDVPFLLELGSQVMKIASIDCNHYPFLEEIAGTDVPFIVSTGMADLGEIDETYRKLKSWGKEDIALLHCVSNYPPKPEQMNMRNIQTMRDAFDVPIGFSDHSISNTSAIASIALGATIIEKHITMDRQFPGPDHPFALEPKDMKELVDGVRETELALGSTQRIITPDEQASRTMIRRSMVALKDIEEGTTLEKGMFKYARPGEGVSPNEGQYVYGRKLRKSLKAEDLLQWGDLY